MGYLLVRVDLNKLGGLSTNLARDADRAEHAVATQAALDTDPYVPMATGSLKDRTAVQGNLIIYPGPYARYLYYGKKMVDLRTGKGPMHFIGKNGNEVIRWRHGQKLRPTNIPLNIRPNKTSIHAQAHWFEASKAQNLEKWLEVAKRAMLHDYGK